MDKVDVPIPPYDTPVVLTTTNHEDEKANGAPTCHSFLTSWQYLATNPNKTLRIQLMKDPDTDT